MAGRLRGEVRGLTICEVEKQEWHDLRVESVSVTQAIREEEAHDQDEEEFG